MKTFTTTLTLHFGGKDRQIEIHADYSLLRGYCAVREVGGLALVPEEVRSVDIVAVRAKIRGHEYGFANRLTDDQWGELEVKILESEDFL